MDWHMAGDEGGGGAVRATVLVVDDDRLLRERLVRALIQRGFDARGAASVEEAMILATEESPEMAVVDLRMPGGSGLDLIPRLLAMDAATKIVVLSGYGSIATALEAIRLGAVNFLPKPADVDDILAAFDPETSRGRSETGAWNAPSLARAEWEHIQRVLADCSGNISEAARRLGLHRRSLQRKLQKRPPSE